MLDPLNAFSAVETIKNTNTDLQRACMKNKKLIVLAVLDLVGSRSAFTVCYTAAGIPVATVCCGKAY